MAIIFWVEAIEITITTTPQARTQRGFEGVMLGNGGIGHGRNEHWQ